MRNASRNQTAAARVSQLRGDPLACFDRLPPELRAAYHEAVVDWCPLEVRWNLNKLLKLGYSLNRAVDLLLEGLAEGEQEELHEFGRGLPRIFGGTSPHLAAKASIQRYGRRA